MAKSKKMKFEQQDYQDEATNNIIDLLQDFDFNSYVKMPIWSRLNRGGEVTDKTYFEVASDGHHPGLEHMTEISDAFYEATVGEKTK